MYLLSHLIINKLFLDSINTFDFINNLTIGATLINIEVFKFIFLNFFDLINFCCQFQNHKDLFVFEFPKINQIFLFFFE